MKVCIDTNVVVGLLSENHPYRPIFDEWFSGRLIWTLTTEIVLEYEEILQRLSGKAKANKLFKLLDIVGRLHQNVVKVKPEFRFQLIRDDPDDNKFSDAAIVAGAAYIITEDHHFQSMVGSGYRPQPITPTTFISEILKK